MKKLIFYLLLFSGLVFADTPPNPPPIFQAPLVQTGRNVSCNVASSSQSGCLSASDWTRFNSATGYPGGSNGTIQYNNSGVFGGFGSWNGTLLSIPGNFGVTGSSSLDGGDITTNGSGNMSVGGTLGVTGLFTTHGGAAFNGNMGFFGTTPISKPSGDVLLGLANLGLINSPILQSNDIPNNAANTTGTATNVTATTNNTLQTLSALSLPATQITGQLSIAHGGTGQATQQAAINALLPSQSGNAGLFLTTDGNNVSWYEVSGDLGTVTSVGLALPSSVFTVINSPITSSGTITGNLNTQSANTVWAGPTGGGAATPTFRLLTAADIPSLSYVSAVNATSPVSSTGGTTPTISISQATTSTSGYLSSTDWNTFNSKQSTLTFNSPLSNVSNIVSISQATTSTNGYLSSTDWNTFNSKGNGTVTSVSVTPPASIISVTGNPVTGSGSIVESLVNQSANTFWAGPTSGSAMAPTFRAITPADVPTLNQNTTGTASNVTSTSNSTLATLPSLSLPGSQVTGNIAGNSANVTGVVAIANGGTGQVTANAALNAFLPTQTGNTSYYLQTDGTNTSWQPVTATGVTSVTATAPIVSSGGSNPNITCNVASGSQAGCLASADWNTFNGKQNALTFGNLTSTGAAGISITGGTGAVIGSGTMITQQNANTSQNGYLLSSDWNTFNDKMGLFTIAGTVFVALNGNDSTCEINRLDLPCLTVTQAEMMAGSQASFGNLWAVSVGPGYYAEPAMDIYPFTVITGQGARETNIFLANYQSAVGVVIDFQNNNPTLDSSWGTATGPQLEGGFENVFLTSTGSPGITDFNFSSFDNGAIVFVFTNDLISNGGITIEGLDSNDGNTTNITFNGTDVTGGVTMQSGYYLVENGSFGGTFELDATGTYSRTLSYCLGATYYGAMDFEGTGTQQAVMANFSCNLTGGQLILDGPNALYEAGYIGFPVASSISITGGGITYFDSDPTTIGYTPAVPSDWPSPQPTTVQNALDTLVTLTGSGGANTALSNLTSPTSVNQILIPYGDEAVGLGTATNRWNAGFIGTLYDSSSNSEIILDARQLDDATGLTSADWTNRLLYQSSGNESLDWNNDYLLDNTEHTSVDWENRNLDDSTSTAQLSWSTSGVTIANNIGGTKWEVHGSNGALTFDNSAISSDGSGDLTATSFIGNLTGNASGTSSNVTGTVAIAHGGTGQTTANAALNALLPSQTGNTNYYLQTNGTNTSWAPVSGGGSGTVTSVTFTGDGTVLSSTPSSAVTTSGTLNATLNTQSANTVLAGPSSGSAATPTFRALVAADIPSLSYANETLSNLTSPVALNQNLLPGTNFTENVGEVPTNTSPNNKTFSGMATVTMYVVDNQNSPYHHFSVEAPNLSGGDQMFVLPSNGGGSSGQFLQTDGSGDTSWQTVSAANFTLSNLTSPTAINESLIFNNSAAYSVQSPNLSTSGASTQNLTVQTGNTTYSTGSGGGSTGNLYLETGTSISNTASTGTIYLETGQNSGGTDGQTGSIQIQTGQAGPNGSGSVTIETGSEGSANGSAGDVLIEPGDAPGFGGSGGGNAGSIALQTQNGAPTALGAQDGGITISDTHGTAVNVFPFSRLLSDSQGNYSFEWSQRIFSDMLYNTPLLYGTVYTFTVSSSIVYSGDVYNDSVSGNNYVIIDQADSGSGVTTIHAQGTGSPSAMSGTLTLTIGQGEGEATSIPFTAYAVDSGIFVNHFISTNSPWATTPITGPTLSACGAATLSAAANDTSGSITTSGSDMTCTLNFSTPFANVPHCFVNVQFASSTSPFVTPTTTSFTITMNVADGTVIDYFCVGEE